ncbi:MAG: pyrimidine-nucleoside phosphorylase [Defluviitaleaceae bacterium]|nr:pyrimidine-nucleoside phosphorylase [Defluviitaleaceae bacterium]
MRIYDIINKKKRGGVLTNEEIRFVIDGFTAGSIPDYQVSALLMAIYFQGMNAEETTAITMAMVDSGERVDLSAISGTTVDKHSTGGVGDKTTLIVIPIVAALGLPVAKMSGRGLGHTGGTVDKLESIPGFRTALSDKAFLDITINHGLCVAGQSANLAPADKKLYALRDVTATVDSIPLIAASIMSKKIAAGAECILLDVKTGSGAFMKTLEGAQALAKAMVDIGKGCGRKTAALITDMSAPLGRSIGNSLELKEVIQVLSEPAETVAQDLYSVCIALATNIAVLAECGTYEECEAKVKQTITSGDALKKLADMVEAQGGDRSYIEDPKNFPLAPHIVEITAPQGGYISDMDTEGVGIAGMILGAGRETSEDEIDYSAGVILHATTGDRVEKGQIIATFHTSKSAAIEPATSKFIAALTFAETPPPPRTMIYGKVGF